MEVAHEACVGQGVHRAVATGGVVTPITGRDKAHIYGQMTGEICVRPKQASTMTPSAIPAMRNSGEPRR